MFFTSKYLKIFMVVPILFLGVLRSDTFCGDFLRYDHDISGKIVDFDTRRPIEGVVVSAVWFYEQIRLSIEPKRTYYDYCETLTDQDGNFRIPGKGLNIIRKISPPTISIFKAGYSVLYLQDLGVHFRQDHPLSDEVKWEGDKAIIPFRKKSSEERKRYLRSHPTTPFLGMTYAGVPSEKVRLYLRELEREYKAAGMTPTQLNAQRYLRYKKGGVSPAEENSVKRESSE